MWSRRIAILATFAFIRVGRFNESLALAKKFLSDKEDLMHKATGWMLREVGKRDKKILEKFLKQYAIHHAAHNASLRDRKIFSGRARAFHAPPKLRDHCTTFPHIPIRGPSPLYFPY